LPAGVGQTPEESTFSPDRLFHNQQVRMYAGFGFGGFTLIFATDPADRYTDFGFGLVMIPEQK
jgi:hypothetical protein